jgi:hypothetical protein
MLRDSSSEQMFAGHPMSGTEDGGRSLFGNVTAHGRNRIRPERIGPHQRGPSCPASKNA